MSYHFPAYSPNGRYFNRAQLRESLKEIAPKLFIDDSEFYDKALIGGLYVQKHISKMPFINELGQVEEGPVFFPSSPREAYKPDGVLVSLRKFCADHGWACRVLSVQLFLFPDIPIGGISIENLPKAPIPVLPQGDTPDPKRVYYSMN